MACRLQVPLVKPRSSSLDGAASTLMLSGGGCGPGGGDGEHPGDERRSSCENLLSVEKQQRSTSVDVSLPTSENRAYRAITRYGSQDSSYK